MFSARLPADLRSSSFAQRIAAAHSQGRALLDLTVSNPTRAGMVYPEREILAGFQDSRALVYEPSPFGIPEARERIAALEHVSPERVLLTASTSEGYSWLFKLLCNSGDEILVPRPSYPLFEMLAQLEGVAVRHYPLRYQGGWFVDTHALESMIGARTRAVVVVHPNNPTGSYLKRHEQAEIARICSSSGVALISDEVFGDYSFGPDPERAGSINNFGEARLAFGFNGLSKLAGMPQMKLGWMVVTGELAREAMERLEMIADTYLSVGAPVQHALPALLTARESIQAQILTRLHENLAEIRRQVEATSATLLNVEGGWSAILRVPRTQTEEEWVTSLLQDHSVLVQPGYFYDFETEAHLVVSLLTPPEVFRQGLARILDALDRGPAASFRG